MNTFIALAAATGMSVGVTVAPLRTLGTIEQGTTIITLSETECAAGSGMWLVYSRPLGEKVNRLGCWTYAEDKVSVEVKWTDGTMGFYLLEEVKLVERTK